MFGAFTYIAFTLTEVTGFSASTVPWLLILFGVGLFIGNTAGGKAADRNVDRTLLVALAALVVVLVVFALTAGNQPMTIASMVLLGGFGFATVPGLQMRVMKYATTAPTLASGANIGAFNVGNALGAWLGGVTITAGLGYTSPIWAGAGITLLGLAVMVFAAAAARRRPPLADARVGRSASGRRTGERGTPAHLGPVCLQFGGICCVENDRHLVNPQIGAEAIAGEGPRGALARADPPCLAAGDIRVRQ